MIENPAKFNKMAALFAAVAGGLFALYLMGNVFFRLLELFDSIDYYLNHIGALLVELIYLCGDCTNVLAQAALIFVLLRGKKDLLAAIGVAAAALMAILFYCPALFFNELRYIINYDFVFSRILEDILVTGGILGLLIFRSILALNCFTVGKFPGAKLSWVPMAALGLYVITTFLSGVPLAYVISYGFNYYGLLTTVEQLVLPSLSVVTVMELIAAVFLAFAFWIPCMETEKIPEAVEGSAEN